MYTPDNILTTTIDKAVRWSRTQSMWPVTFGLACCAIEVMAVSGPRHDFMRLGVIPLPASPRQADFMIVAGTVTDKMAPSVKRLYDQMPEPKYVISMGSCSNSGGPYWDSYSVTKGVDQLIPVDVYVPGCPPRPEALMQGLLMLQESIGKERRPITWAAGDQTVVKPHKISKRDELTAERIQATELREPKNT